LRNQLAQLRQFAAMQNWTITYEYVDHATGKHSDREQFQRLFLDASQRQFDLERCLVPRSILKGRRLADTEPLEEPD
jgi:DNA invertase Pin-like site-specific DNA recombinase